MSTDFPDILITLKKKWGSKFPWGSLVAIPIDGVLYLGWINNNTVLLLSTVHTVNQVGNVIRRQRKRPLDTSTNARNARKPFEGLGARVDLEIPCYIDEYNFNMGGVDIADQYRQVYTTQRIAQRNWSPLQYQMLDYIYINAFKLAVHAPEKHWTKGHYKNFRELLQFELFGFAI